MLLRRPRRTDEAELLALRRASWEFLRPWEPDLPGVDPLGHGWFARYMRFGPEHARLRLLICARRSGRIRGSLSLGEIDRQARRCTIGYWIGRAFARKGYTSEAVSLAVDYAAAELGVQRVEAYVLPENSASKRLLARVGFERAGSAADYRVVHGAPRDHERWIITGRARRES